ncbi:DUF3047 domain-containing protein [Cupriavidus campinensis]
MTAAKYWPALAAAAGAFVLGGCASTAESPPVDPAKMAAVTGADCKTFAVKANMKTAGHVDPLEAANLASLAAADAESGGDGDADGEGEGSTAAPLTLSDPPPFSASVNPSHLPLGWQPWTINRNKIPTRYALAEVDQRLVLHAQADSSASGLYVPLSQRDPGTLRWTWKTRDVIRSADNGMGQREDAPLRIFVAFDGDRSNLSLRDQLMYEMARITTGRDMPYATLMYIWGGRRPEGAVLNNPHTDRVRMIVVDSGSRHTNSWRCHERDLRADYRKAFGTDPGKVIAVGLMTDTDNTKSRAESWYGDIELESASSSR